MCLLFQLLNRRVGLEGDLRDRPISKMPLFWQKAHIGNERCREAWLSSYVKDRSNEFTWMNNRQIFSFSKVLLE